MVYNIVKIKQDVRVCIDQNRSAESLFESEDADSLMLDEVIGSKVAEGVERVHKAAPYDMLELGHNFNENLEPFWGDMESGHVVLPDDFMRLVVFEMSDWERSVYVPITPEDPQYKTMRSRIKGLRGNAQRPVCAVCVRPEGKVLEFYSCKTKEAYITRAVYMPYPIVDAAGNVDISERCYEATVYTIAGLTLTSCGEAEKGKYFMAMAQQLLGVAE